MCFKSVPITEKNNFYNKLVTEKGVPLSQMKAIKTPKRFNAYHKFLFFIFIFTLSTIIIINSKHGLLRINSQIKAIPSENQWNKYASCVFNSMNANCCSLSLVSFIHPPKETVVLLAQRGVGGKYLRYLIQQSTRVWTGVESCTAVDKLNAHFSGGCAGSYHYRHYIVTQFFTPYGITKEIGYTPTHLIHLTRNPFYALISSFAYYLNCEESWTCMSDFVLKATDFNGNNTNKWITYAKNFALNWELEFKYANAYNNTLRVYYEDLIKDYTLVLEPVLIFIHQPLLLNVSKSIACSFENTNTQETKIITKSEISSKDVFSLELIKELCKSFGLYWNENKWGANICL